MEKQKYSIWQNAWFVIKDFWGWQKKLVVMGIIRIPLVIILPLVVALIPKVIIDIMEQGGGAPQLVVAIPVMTVIAIFLYCTEKVASLWVDDSYMRARYRYLIRINEKTMDMDYELLSSAKGKILRARALRMLENQAATIFEGMLVALLSNCLGLISYGGVLATLNPWILVVLILSYGVTWYLNRLVNRYIESKRQEQAENQRRIDYVVFKAIDLAAAKDIRLYSLRRWFIDFGKSLIQKENRIVSQIALRRWASMAVAALLILLRDGLAYAILIQQVISGEVPVSDFLVYFTMISTFAEWVSGILQSWANLNLSNSGLNDLRNFWEMEETAKPQKTKPIPPKEEWPCEIELQQVGYTYPESEKETLKGIDLKIHAGERLAIVGINGAGKTTLIKLICGLFHPTQGRILVNGEDIKEYDPNEYFDLFSVIFQDVHLLPTSIVTNITMQERGKEDTGRLEKCLQQSGIASRIERLPEGLETLMVKNVNESAYELSGGETQKLLLARALYKEAPILILDEPTAALDPIAENELYLQYRDLTEGRTSLFISHRFASTRFCDRIILMDQGGIAEVGTHEELMEKGGLYAEMYQVQSQYYQEENQSEGEEAPLC